MGLSGAGRGSGKEAISTAQVEIVIIVWEGTGERVVSYQLKVPGTFDGLDAAVHSELGIDALGVSPERADRDDEFIRDLGTCEAAGQKPEHLLLALAEGFEQRLLWGTVSQRPG